MNEETKAMSPSAILLLVLLAAGPQAAQPERTEERTEHFDRDPGWDAHNNRSTVLRPRTVRQDFGFSSTAQADGKSMAIGGFITPAAEPAYYAKSLPAKT